MESSYDGALIGGRWRLGPRLGGGSQGEIFLARDSAKHGEGVVIVKRLTPKGTWKSFELFEREAKVLSQLRHPGVPRHYATIEEPPGTFNLVMQRAPGDNLRDLAKRRRLSEFELRDIMIRTLEILDYLHTRMPPVIHRDIKPSNILRSYDGRISLVDFGGVAGNRMRDDGGSTIVGTLGYMAPEQLHGQATPATDIYALGATMVALAGGVDPEDVPRKGLRMDLDKQLPSIERGLRHALIKMTEPDPDQRPQRARDVLALLAAVPPPPESAESAEPPSRALVTTSSALPARRMFSDISEPLATVLRFGVLGIGAAGWLGMTGVRLGFAIVISTAALIAFPAFRRIVGVGRELDAMLVEGRSGFSDMMRGAMARKK